jgi:hypothetical protein
MYQLILPIAVIALSLPAGQPGPTVAKAPALSAKDKACLDGLIKDFLIDPRGAERVRFQMAVRSVWTGTGEVTAEGWLVPGKDGQPGTVYLFDGPVIPAPAGKLRKVDFVAECQGRYAGKGKVDELVDPEPKRVFDNMSLISVGEIIDDHLALAAWLYRLGKEDLAALALAAARVGDAAVSFTSGRGDKGDPRQFLREDLAWSAYAKMIHAYMVRADSEALAYGERLLRLYRDVAEGPVFDRQENALLKKHRYPEAQAVLDDLKRRQKKGTFGIKPAETLPNDFRTWGAEKKVAYLVDALEEVDARQHGQPGDVPLESDRRVAELIGLGDVAVPRLIDVLENDQRLTRSVHFFRDHARSRTVLAARDVALTALMAILKVRFSEMRGPGDRFASDEERAKKTAQVVRAYWNKVGRLSFADRSMAVLTDPKAGFEERLEAAENLADLGQDRPQRGRFKWRGLPARPNTRPNSAVGKFSNPTVAEAMVQAMDARLQAFEAERDNDYLRDYSRSVLEDSYLSPIIELGDKRLAPEAVRRSQATNSVRLRRKWAYVAHWLGDSQPLRKLAEDFRNGNVELPRNAGRWGNPGDQPGNVELLGIINAFTDSGIPEGERALDALVDVHHRYHSLTLNYFLEESAQPHNSPGLFRHAIFIRVLRTALDDKTPTGQTYKIENGMLSHRWSFAPISDLLANPETRRDEAAERICDQAAEKLDALVAGLPACNPLLRDADKRIATMKATLDRFAGHYRRINPDEYELFRKINQFYPGFIPDVRPLGRPANSEDVKAAKAIFHFDGQGRLADQALPAFGTFKSSVGKVPRSQALIVQAEVSPNGVLTYGVIEDNDVRAVPASEITEVKPLAAR